MTNIVMPCDTLVRLMNVLAELPQDVEPAFRCIRLDNGCAVATDRHFMAIEKVNDFDGIFYIQPDQALIDQCRTEATFSSNLTITVNEILRYTAVKTGLGYVHPVSVGAWHQSPDFDRWREVVARCKEPANENRGGMFWNADGIARLASASPSGSLVFEQHIDTTRPTLIRDVHDFHWLGVFNPWSTNDAATPATLPSWVLA